MDLSKRKPGGPVPHPAMMDTMRSIHLRKAGRNAAWTPSTTPISGRFSVTMGALMSAPDSSGAGTW